MWLPMRGLTDTEWREALYRQMARQSGLPAGLRAEMIRRAERCAGLLSEPAMAAFIVARDGVEGCKGAARR